MKNIKNILVGTAVVAFSALTANSVVAADKGLYIVPSVGYQYFDSDRPDSLEGSKGFDEDMTYGLGIGYQLNKRVAVELQYNYADADYKGQSSDTDAQFHYLHADALVGFPELKFWHMEPYVVAGVGHSKVDYDLGNDDKAALIANGTPFSADDNDGTTFNAGIGTHIDLYKNLKLRFDVRGVHNIDNEDTDATANLGLNWLMWPTGATPAPVAAAPKDSDGDGVIDSLDKCPDTKAGAKVDASGCYLDLMETKTFTMDVNFNYDSANLREESIVEIQELAAFMKQYPQANVVLEGHTDSKGSEAYNQQLSEKRAASVASALVEKFGVDASKISTVGYGESKPIASNATKEGRAQNRRTVGNVQATVTVQE